ncbi:MAG: O-antigen ligase family protein [Candidatus Gorgyraea atricola]|nr:O-antigen ligase family protein [Candidatus Gorgyraea atricola]
MMKLFLILILAFAPIARGAARVWAFAPIQIFTLAVLLYSIFKMSVNREIRIKRTPLDIPIVLFLFVFIVSCFNSSYAYASIMEFTKLFTLASIFYLTINFVKTKEDIKKVLNAVLIVATAIALFGILQYIGAVDRSWWAKENFLSATYVNHNHFAGLLELTIPLSIGMFLSERTLGKKSLYVYSTLILCVAFLLSMSRGGWLSLSISMLFMIMCISISGRLRLTKKTGIAILLLMIGVGVFALKAAGKDALVGRVSSYRYLDFSGRLDIWKASLSMIKDNWFLGTGPGTFIYSFPKYRLAGMNMLVNYAHNDYLHVLSELGVFALGIMVFTIFTIVKKAIRTYRVANSSFKMWISLALATGILSIAIHGIGDFNFYMPANAILFTVFSAFIFNLSSRKEKKIEPLVIKHGPVFKPLVLTAVIALIIFITSSLAADVCRLSSQKALSNNELNKAEYMMFLATRICPLNYKYHYELAKIYDKKTDVKRSAQSYERSIALNPLDAWSWMGLADNYYRRNIGLADSAYRKAVELDPLNSYYLKKFGKFLVETGDSGLSSSIYKKASYAESKSETLSILPTDFADGETYQEKAALSFSAQNINKALVFYEMAENLLEETDKAKLGQVKCYLKMSLLGEALNRFREIQPSISAKSTLFACMGDYYLRKGSIDTANRFLEKSITLDPENPEPYQVRYKISKAKEDSSKILSFNSLLTSTELGEDGLEITFELKKQFASEGRLSVDLILPAGIYEFNVKARGKDALDIWPHMEVWFNNKKSLDTHVTNIYWNFYPGIVVVDYPVNRMDIIFDNDYYDENTLEDRNLCVHSISLKAL